jgi:lysophospholipase L1-like esterase
MKYLVGLSVVGASLFSSPARSQSVAPFKTGDKVMFVGNSITNEGLYHSYIWLYYMTHYPGKRIEILNRGIGGDDVGQMNDRLDIDVLSGKPSVVVLTFGMNDSGYFEYLTNNRDSVGHAKVQRSYNNYLKVEEKLKNHPEIKKVILTSANYDATTTSTKNNRFPGKSKSMEEIAVFQEASAKTNNWSFVDIMRPMGAINISQQARDSSFSLSPGDRIHPGADGHLVMAYYFLKAQGLANKNVASVNIDAVGNKLLKADNSTVTNVSAKASSVKFNYLANSLPFPMDTLPRIWESKSVQSDALKVIPFTKEFNQEMIYVQNLQQGNYVLKIDGEKIGEWSDKDFSTGVNLAEQMNTPQYQQAIQIRDLNQERMEIEKRFRQYNWVEFDVLREKGLLRKHNQAALDTVRAQLNNWFIRGNYENWTKARNPATRDAWNAEMKILVDTIYKISMPKVHVITIERV